MIKTYDIGIIGAGVAGAFAALRVAENYKNTNAVLFELGRPPGKRRRQLEGWLGCLPFSDGKLRIDDIENVKRIADDDLVIPANDWVKTYLGKAGNMRVLKDKKPSATFNKKANSLGFETVLNDYVQWDTAPIHKLSKIISDKIEESGNVEFSFDNEVYQILKKDGVFNVITQKGDFQCKNILLAVGRSGWRWVTNLYKLFGLLDDESDSVARYGIRVEIASQYMKDLNKSRCSLLREDLELGPFDWDCAVIPEDHADLVISSSCSIYPHLKRLGKDKVTFSLIGKKTFPGQGVAETERLGKLTFLMCNDRVGRERIKHIIKKDSFLSQLPEYDWLASTLKELETLFPSIITKGYYHAPTISPMAPSINLDDKLQSELQGVYVSGESANLYGIMAAAISGTAAVDGALK